MKSERLVLISLITSSHSANHRVEVRELRGHFKKRKKLEFTELQISLIRDAVCEIAKHR